MTPSSEQFSHPAIARRPQTQFGFVVSILAAVAMLGLFLTVLHVN